MRLSYAPAAVKALLGMPRDGALALRRKLEQFAAARLARHDFAKPLVGGGVRVRHGDWRAVCRVDGTTMLVLVVRIGHRREVYG